MMVKGFDWSVKHNDCLIGPLLIDWFLFWRVNKFVGHCFDRVNFPTVEIVTQI